MEDILRQVSDDDLFEYLSKAANIIKKYYFRDHSLDKNELVNSAWIRIQTRESIQKTPKKYIIRKLIQVMLDHLRNKHKYNTRTKKAPQVLSLNKLTSNEVPFLNFCLYTDDDRFIKFENQELIKLMIQAKLFTILESNILYLRFNQALTMQEIADELDYQSKSTVFAILNRCLVKAKYFLRLHGVSSLC